MDQTQSINRYRNLLVIFVLFIIALAMALYDAKTAESEAKALVATPPSSDTDSRHQTPLFRIGDKVYSYQNLTEEFQTPLYQIRKVSFQQQMLVLEQAIIETRIHQQALSAGSVDAALKQLFPDITVTAEEVEHYYQQNQNSQTPPFESMREQLADYLLSLKRENAKRELLTQMLVSGNAQVLFEAPPEPGISK